MTYFILSPLAPPHQQRGELVGWHETVPDLQRRSDISYIWMDGRGILNPAEMPNAVSLMWHRPLPAVFSSNGGIIICNEKVKNLLEELDPGLHQFIPIKVGFRSGEAMQGNHFILNVHHTLDTVVDEKTKARKGTEMLPGNPHRHYMRYELSAHENGDVAVDKSKLTSASLWRELAYSGLYMSSERFQERLNQEGLSFFEPHKANEF